MEKAEIKKNLEQLFKCGTCKYVYFDPNDKEENKKCEIVGRYNDYPINRMVKKAMMLYDLKEVCESWQLRPSPSYNSKKI